MAIIDGLLQEMEQDAQATRRVLERVPDAHLAWKPHAKSYSLGQLALHTAQLPGMVAELSLKSLAAPPAFVQESVKSSAELIPALQESIARARTLLGGMDDAAMHETWRLAIDGREVMALPRVALLRAIMLNHWYHHRGQLTVYLRQLDIPVPSIYGPSADESPFA